MNKKYCKTNLFHQNTLLRLIVIWWSSNEQRKTLFPACEKDLHATQCLLETNLQFSDSQQSHQPKEDSQHPPAHPPCSNGHQNHTVQVELTPLLHVMGECGAEQGSSHHVGCARQEDGSQLLPKPRLPIFKELVRLIHHQPFHTGNREVLLSVKVTWEEGRNTNRPITDVRATQTFSVKASSKARFEKDSWVPGQVYCWRILLQQINESVWSSNQYIYRKKGEKKRQNAEKDTKSARLTEPWETSSNPICQRFPISLNSYFFHTNYFFSVEQYIAHLEWYELSSSGLCDFEETRKVKDILSVFRSTSVVTTITKFLWRLGPKLLCCFSCLVDHVYPEACPLSQLHQLPMCLGRQQQRLNKQLPNWADELF